MDATTLEAGLLIVVGGTVVAVAGLFAVVRWMPGVRNREDEGAKGVFFSMVGVLYALLLAFVVVLVWGDFVDAGDNSLTEVARMRNLARDADAFPNAETVRIHQRLGTYARAVAGPEWATMANGNSSPVAERAYDEIWDEYYRIEPKTEREKAFYAESVARLNDLGESRRLRLLSSRSTVPALMWGLLAVGFVITIGWTYLFELRTMAMNAVAVGSVAALSAFVLFLIYALEHPFAGEVKISRQPYVEFARQYTPSP